MPLWRILIVEESKVEFDIHYAGSGPTGECGSSRPRLTRETLQSVHSLVQFFQHFLQFSRVLVHPIWTVLTFNDLAKDDFVIFTALPS